jgi:T3SS negative regulator,GrlR
MTNGLYSVTFGTPRGDRGSGIAVFHASKVQGGDDVYFYDGTLVERESDSIAVDILVRKYGIGESVLGDLSEFRLILTGVTNDRQFTLSGHIASAPDQRLTVECVKLAS